MLNPYLEQTLYSVPVQPILIEFDPEKFAESLSQITGIFAPFSPFGSKPPSLLAIPFFSIAGLTPVTPETIKFINGLPGVRVIHADRQNLTLQMPSKPSDWWPTTESRKVMEADLAFQAGFTGESTTVGVVDTGVDALHPQLLGTEWYTTMIDKEPVDEVGHGSHVASTIAGKPLQSIGGISVQGVSRARLICVKCLGRGIGSGFDSEIANAMSLCAQKGCQVISMSLGSNSPQGGVENDPLCKAVANLTRQGIIIVIAAGNSGPKDDTIGSPGCSPDALTVAAVDKNLNVASFSSRGGATWRTKPDCAAPGVLVYSGTSQISPMSVEQPQAGYGYVAISGTSMATPHASGLVAILKQRNPNLTTAMIKAVLAQRGHAWNKDTGYGIPTWSMFS